MPDDEDLFDPVISKGPDAGKRESELFREIFESGETDLEYFNRRKAVLLKPTEPDSTK